MFIVLASNYGWTFEEIRKMTVPEQREAVRGVELSRVKVSDSGGSKKGNWVARRK